jgi:type IVB pilus formation R64 PilN family outer membrane protein
MAKKQMRTRVATACLIACAVLGEAGCAGYKAANSSIDNTRAHIEADKKKMGDEKTPVVAVSHDAWLLGDAVPVQEQKSPVLTQHVTYANPNYVSLADIASWLTANYGLPVDISDLTGDNGRMNGSDSDSDSDYRAGASGAGMAGSPTAMRPGAAMPALPLPPNFLRTAASRSDREQRLRRMKLSYDGDMDGFLQVVAEKEGVWQKLVDGRAVFYRTETKTIYMPAIARHSNVKSSMVASGAPTTGVSIGQMSTGTSSGGGDSGQAGQTTITADYDIDFWKEIEETAKTISPGALVSVSPALGSITVTGTPTQVRHVEQWARGVSEDSSQMVAVTMRLLTVTLNQEDSANWSPSVLLNKLGSPYKWTASAPSPTTIASGLTPFSLGFSVLSGSSSSLAGSQAMLNLLSTMGNVSGDKTWSTVVLNGQLSPVQMATQVTYAASSGGIATANVGTTSLIQPGVVTTGLTGNVRPRIVNGKVTLALDVTDSVLQTLTTFSSGGASIQEPKISITQLPSSIAIKPGETLLATGITDTAGTVNQNGVFTPSNPILGGGSDGNWTKTMVVVEITAEVM